MSPAQFAREKGLHPQNWTFLNNADKLIGVKSKYFIRAGQYWNNPNEYDIELRIISMGITEVFDVSVDKN